MDLSATAGQKHIGYPKCPLGSEKQQWRDVPASEAALLFGACWSSCLHLVLLVRLSGGAEAFQSCGGRRRAAVHRQSASVHGADVIQRIVLFPLPEVAELSEAQLLWLEAKDIQTSIKTKAKALSLRWGLYLYFGGGGEGYVTRGVGVFSLLLRCLTSHQSRKGCGEVTA